MKANNSLYSLVHALTPNEKRYFKRFSILHSEKKEGRIYLEIFECLVQQPHYDGDALQRVMEEIGYAGQLAVAKNYLQKLILKTMRNYRADRNVKVKLREMIMDAEFLEEKQLFPQAYKKLTQALKLARKQELKLFELEIINQMRWLVKEKQLDKGKESIKQLIAEADLAAQHLMTEQAYFKVFDQVMLFQMGEVKLRGLSDREGLQQMVEDPFLTQPSPGLSFQANHLCHLANGFSQQLLGDDEAARNHFQDCVAHWDRHLWQKDSNPIKYQRLLVILLHSCWLVQDFQRFPEYLEKLSQGSSSTPQGRFSLERNIHFYQLLYCLNTHAFAEGIQQVDKVLRFLKESEMQLTLTWRMGFLYNSFLVCFLSGALEKAGQLLVALNSLGKSGNRSDVQRSMRLFALLLAYEKGDMDLLAYQYRSTRKYFKDKGYLFSFEKILFSCLRALINTPPGNAHKLIFQEALTELGKVPPEDSKPNESHEIVTWLRSQAIGVSMLEILSKSRRS